MIRSRNRTALLLPIALLATWLGSCSSGGLLQPPKSSGIIGMTLVGPETPLSQASVLDIVGGFAVQLFEQNYNAQFNASMTTFTAPTQNSCYTVAMDTTGRIATFTPRASPAPVCLQIGSDVETALFVDQQMHQNTLSFTNIPALPLPIAASVLTENFVGSTSPITSSLLVPAPIAPAILGTVWPVGYGFSIAVSSSGSAGPFSALIVSWTASTLGPCYSTATSAPNVFVFTPASPSPAPSATGTNNPCATGDTEGVVFADGHGNYNEQFLLH